MIPRYPTRRERAARGREGAAGGLVEVRERLAALAAEEASTDEG